MNLNTIQIQSNSDLIIKGLNTAVDIIKSTMGAKGKNVAIREGKNIRFTKDGVSVAKAINLPGFEGIGSEAVTSSAQKTVFTEGDGTTQTSVLLQSFVNQAKLYPSKDIYKILKEMEISIETLIEKIKSKSIDLKSLEELEQIATIASNSKKLGKVIHDCYKEVGLNSLVTLEKSSYESDTYFEVKKGIKFNSGMVNSKFSNRIGEKCVFDKAYIIIENKEIRTFSEDWIKLFTQFKDNNIPLVIIAPDFSRHFVRATLQNLKSLEVCLIKSPGYGENVLENLKDIQAYTTNNLVDKITITRNDFILHNTPSESLKERLDLLNQRLEIEEDEYEYNKIKKRLHRLKGSAAIIYTGGITVESQNEEYDRLEDALGSVKAAIANGYLPGGGTLLYTLSHLMEVNTEGAKIVSEAIQLPIKTILENAELIPEVILEHFNVENINQGYNVITNKYVDMLEEGIIDPTSVITSSILNAFASSKLILNNKYNLINVIQ